MVLDDAFIRVAETAEPSARACMPAERRRLVGAPEPLLRGSGEPPGGWVSSKARRRGRARRG
ncbi:hypothetical protein ORI94_01345 [Streptomyces sp. NEAU-W12]|nr:hypothetical protein [Streptomyces sp. NEAU-W12]